MQAVERTTWAAIGLIGLAALFLAALGTYGRRAGWGRRPGRDPATFELAMIVGGRPRVVLAALAGLRFSGAIDAMSDGVLTAVGPLPADSGPLTQQVYRAASSRLRASTVVDGGAQVGPAVDEIREATRRAGWIWADPGGPKEQARGCLSWLWLWAGTTLWFGWASCAAVLLGQRHTSGWSGAVLVLAAMVPAWWTVIAFSSHPQQTRSGRRVLLHQQYQHRHLVNGVRTRVEAENFVALGGMAALWKVDPEFADRTRLSPPAARRGEPEDGGYDGGYGGSSSDAADSGSSGDGD